MKTIESHSFKLLEKATSQTVRTTFLKAMESIASAPEMAITPDTGISKEDPIAKFPRDGDTREAR